MKYQIPQLQAAGVASQLIQNKTAMGTDGREAFHVPPPLSTLLEK
jgi:hypothetical protein